MFHLGRIRSASVGLLTVVILAIGITFHASAQDLPRILRAPVSPVIMRPPAPTQPAPGSDQPSTPVTVKACKAASDCPFGNCYDGVCCNRICDGNCVSCNVPGHEGTCTPVPDGQDPRRSCCIAQGGSAACNAVCMSGRCMWPDVGTPCGLCSGCDGTGRCTETLSDDARCGVVSCQGLSSYCRKYQDLKASRCDSLGVCKAANDPATCTIYTDFYSGVDPAGVRRECATGKAMNCYLTPNHHSVWQDGAVIRYCETGEVCKDCAAPRPGDPADPAEEGPAKLRGRDPQQVDN